MNVIILTKAHGASRQIDFHQPRMLVAAVTLLVGACAGLFGLGYAVAASLIETDPDVRAAALHQTVERQRAELARVRREAQENIEALSVRVGQLQAQAIRLNALGSRLTQMAELRDGEFDFSAPPGRGGPEQRPAVRRASVSTTALAGDLEALDGYFADRGQQLEVLEEVLLDRNLREQVYPQGWPVKSGWISSFFGVRTDPFNGRPARHEGLDFAGRTGTEIMAVAAGVVSWSGDRYGYGKMVELNHGNGYYTRYAHNSKNLVELGDRVEKGQTIALMGSTGRATGANLHFEVLRYGRPVDPRNFIGERR